MRESLVESSLCWERDYEIWGVLTEKRKGALLWFAQEVKEVLWSRNAFPACAAAQRFRKSTLQANERIPEFNAD